jgi:galactokinase
VKEKITRLFIEQFGVQPLIVRSPGRVNIIGEHTDYNEGFVLPAAIDKAVYVAISKRTDTLLHLYSVDFNETHEVELSEILPTKTWATYILGVVDQLMKNGYTIGGFNLIIDGDIPIGAGLSSSAAVECATIFALNELFSLNIGKMDMVRMAQKAEHAYAGVQCGIMDQFASMFGKKDKVIKLDCRSLQYEYQPLDLKEYKLVLLNTNVKHSLASSAYNERRQQCEQGGLWVKEKFPQVNSLRDVNIEMLDECVFTKDRVVYTRCKYVVGEIQRLQDACMDLAKGDLAGLGKKMFATHDGLSNLYEVSCKELDYLVGAVKNNPAVLGARMMGGGFGGCTINIIHRDFIETIINKIGEAYRKNMQLDLSVYIAAIENGTSLLTPGK